MTTRITTRPLAALLAMLALASATLLTLQQLPNIDDIQLRPHAVERHGEDAIRARQGVFDCDADDLRARLCPETEKYGLSVAFWCEPPGSQLCPGMYTTIAGIEKTAFIRPCVDWRECK